jgi:hypothetical protein
VLRVIAVLLVLAAPAARAAEIEGVRFEPTREVMGVRLELHDAALLRYLVFDVYVAALYLGEGLDPERLLDDVPRRLEIEYLYGFSQKQLADATRDGIARNVGDEQAAALAAPIARLSALYRDVQPGDRYALSYVPGAGTELSLNGESLGVVPGTGFSRALFSIWFGDAPFSEDLKRDLLGG